jgi:hypothetical protein
MTTITVKDRIAANYHASVWRQSETRSRRDLGDLLLLATQVEAFDHNYTDKAVSVAERAISAIGNGDSDQCVEELLKLDELRYSDTLWFSNARV